ncbi:MAG TPA: alkaline phosphatase family protein [Pyrinomonadaceae bacterium]|nr:alkaline phosphatase family protein [Pyrinomonadaceae bacterium]
MSQESKKITARKSRKRKSATKDKPPPLKSKKVVVKRSVKTTSAKARGQSTRRVARAAPVRYVPGGPTDNLEKIDHIVVLMMENRSFDHMLGYLKLEGANPDVDGLVAGMSNSDEDQNPYEINRLKGTVFKLDPGHGPDEIAEQLENNNSGFVINYANVHDENPFFDPASIMGYHNASSVPVYDHLARNFCVCDRWFCSVPGATWPNRLYSVTGRSKGKDNRFPPVYNLPSFVRHLDRTGVSWRWYAHDIASLRLIDRHYRVGSGSKFFWFDRSTWVNRTTFLDHAATGDLPAVSWIDPNFEDLPIVGPNESNDDHPPADVMAGQDLVLKLYNAVVSSPAWKKTLLVIVYDEHGGFYDHVVPEDAADDDPQFRKYGVRVPAIVVSPWVERGKVSHKVFDHTSLIKTILLRFCRRDDGTIPDMGARVINAEQLGSLLTLDTPRDRTPVEAYANLIERVAQWRTDNFRNRMMNQSRARAPEKPRDTEFQRGIREAQEYLRAQGLPDGQP